MERNCGNYVLRQIFEQKMLMQRGCILGATILAAMSVVTTLFGHHSVIQCRAFACCQLQMQDTGVSPLLKCYDRDNSAQLSAI
jgi:hypothetical protein